jgi:tRNA modification GTPase
MYTIFAQSSAFGKSGIAVFRISGVRALEILEIMSGKNGFKHSVMRYVTLFSDIEQKQVIDKCMAVYFAGPNSYTGEDLVEIYVHGSIAIMYLLSETVLSMDGVRLAEPGEFTRRAVLNGKMDLLCAEGILDLIESETIMQHRQALSQSSGELSKIYGIWRSEMIKIMSLVEAYIDFPDEDIPESVISESEDKIKQIIDQITQHLADNRGGERLRSGIKVAIFGEPNVGKSSLINYLAMKDIAIVSNIPGTTRDVIESYIDIGGYPIIIADTAGIRCDVSDEVEREGIARAHKAIADADIKIHVFDVYNFVPDKSVCDNTIVVINKIDDVKRYQLIKNTINGEIEISILNNDGLDVLKSEIVKKARMLTPQSATPAITRARYRTNLQKSIVALKVCNLRGDIVLASEDIRMAARYLEYIIGVISVDDILDDVFSNFCIGK